MERAGVHAEETTREQAIDQRSAQRTGELEFEAALLTRQWSGAFAAHRIQSANLVGFCTVTVKNQYGVVLLRSGAHLENEGGFAIWRFDFPLVQETH